MQKDLTAGTIWLQILQKKTIPLLYLLWNVGCDRNQNFLVKLTVCSNFPHQKSKSFLLQQNNNSEVRSLSFWREKKNKVQRQNLVEILKPGWRRWLRAAGTSQALPGRPLGWRHECLCQAEEVTWTHVLWLNIFYETCINHFFKNGILGMEIVCFSQELLWAKSLFRWEWFCFDSLCLLPLSKLTVSP